MVFDQDFSEHRKKLIELGVNPYPYDYEQTHKISDVIKNEEELKDQEVSLTGRIYTIRIMGKTCFADIEDFDSKIQVYLKKDTIGEKSWEVSKLLNIGDIIGVKGVIFRTKTGELTIYVKELTILAKALVQIPFGKVTSEKVYFRVEDKEIRYRERYLDWITSKESRGRFLLRNKIISAIRTFMEERNFVEVETPTLELIYGGAEAKPFRTNVWALGNQEMFLRISPELYLKRYIVGGFPKVYTICKNFRNEGIDNSHNPEFTMMEWYESYTDYNYQMEQFETLVSEVAKKICGTTEIEYQGTKIDFAPPWKRMTMIEAIETLANLSISQMSDEEIIQFYKEKEIELPEKFCRGESIAEIFETFCEDKLIQPTFIIDHPIEISPLTKTKRGNKNLVERFEPFALGMEIGNAYSELTDPVEQYERFKQQQASRENKDDTIHHPMDMDFIKAIGCGMPPTGGVGLGVDRLVMILTNSPSIRDIIPFPLFKPQ